MSKNSLNLRLRNFKTLVIDYLSSFLVFLKRIPFFFKTVPFAEIYLYIVAFLYPILPSYFAIFNARIYTIVALGCLLLLFTTPQIKNISLSLPKLIISSTIMVCFFVCAIVNKELFSTGFLSFLSNYVIVPLYFIFVIDSKQKFERVVNILLVSSVFISIFAVVEALTKFNVFSLVETITVGSIGSGSVDRFGNYRIESSFGQAIAFAIYLTFILCLTYYKMFKKENQNKWRQNLLLAYVLLLNGLIILSGSRFPIIVSLLAQVALFFKLNKRSKIKVGIIVGLVVVVSSLITLITGSSIFKSIFDNIKAIFDGDTSGNVENTSNYRLSLLNYSKLIIGNDILFGRGLHVNQQFFIISKYNALFDRATFDNGYIYIYLTQGIVGVVAWIAFYYSLIVIVVFNEEKEKGKFYYAFGFMVFVAAANMLSVARLDEARTFMIVASCLLACDYHNISFVDSALEQSQNVSSINNINQVD